MGKQRKKAFVAEGCVACGSCIKDCPMGAIAVPHGISAIIQQEKCVGCGKCVAVCPAGIITVIESEGIPNEKTLV